MASIARRAMVLVVLLLGCGQAQRHEAAAVAQRQAQERAMLRPMLTSRFLEQWQGPDGDAVSGAAFGNSPSLVGTPQLPTLFHWAGKKGAESARSADPEPRPYTAVAPFELKTSRGTLRVAPGQDASYIFVVYSKDESVQRLWFNSSGSALFRALPPKAHVVFAATDERGSGGAVRALHRRLSRARGFAAVADRLHFVQEPIELHCTVDAFPKCPLQRGQSAVHQAIVSWGRIEPSLTVTTPGGADEELEATGATDWLPSITDVIRDQGAQSLELAVWGGEACDGRLNMLVEVGAEPQEDVTGKIAMIERGTCGFFTKVSAAMHAGARAVLVTDAADSSGTIEMGCGEPDPCATSPLAIPAAMISYAQAQKLLALRDRWGTAGTTITLNARYEGEHFVGLDHKGRLRELGQIPPSYKDESLALAFVALEAQYYAYELEIEAATEGSDVLTVPLFRGEDQDESKTYLAGGRGIYANAGLPSAEAMAQFDTAQVLMQLDCPGALDKRCGKWDYVVQLHVCSDPAATPARPVVGSVDAHAIERQGHSHASCNVEVGRWVTAYGRPGKWLSDASAVLPVLRAGGRQHFVLSQPAWSTQKYRAVSTLILSNTGKRGVPTASLDLFSGGAFDAQYNRRHRPVLVDIPPRTARAEIHSFITGHGWGTDDANCAEFCETQHRFSVRAAVDVGGETMVSQDAALYQHTLKDAGSDLGCAAQVQDGVTPNQYGTWNFGRAGWCPGGAVKPWIVDVTAGLRPGMKAVIAYAGLFNESAYVPRPCAGDACASEGFAPEINLVSRLVLYENPYDPDLDGSNAAEPTARRIAPGVRGAAMQLPAQAEQNGHSGWRRVRSGLHRTVDAGAFADSARRADAVELLSLPPARTMGGRARGAGGVVGDEAGHWAQDDDSAGSRRYSGRRGLAEAAVAVVMAAAAMGLVRVQRRRRRAAAVQEPLLA